MDVQVAPIALSLTRRLDGIVKGTFYFNRPECDANNLSGCGALLSVKVRGNTRPLFNSDLNHQFDPEADLQITKQNK
jgi:hypothetical protein